MNNLNVLQQWEKWHWTNVLQELKQAKIDLTRKNIFQIVEYMSFKERSNRDTHLCPHYYTSKQSCHPEITDLNCMLCACPNYNSSSEFGGCKKSDNSGKITYHKNLPKGQVWDCSDCTTYHSSESVKIFLEKNITWLRNMSETL